MEKMITKRPEAIGITVFADPADRKLLKVNLLGWNTQNLNFEFCDQEGQEIQKGRLSGRLKKQNISLQDSLSPGFYYLKAVQEERSITVKVLVA